MVVVINIHYKGYIYKATTWYLNGFPTGRNLIWVNSIISGKSPPLYCTLIFITMHSHQSYPNITTVIHSYEYYSPTVDNSTIETYRNRGLVK